MNELTFINGAIVSATDIRKSWGKIVQGVKDKHGEFKHEVRQFEKSYDNQQAEQTSLMV